jgi:UDP-glucose 4-epimerase
MTVTASRLHPSIALAPHVLDHYTSIAVTGGSGFIGTHLVTELALLGRHVRVLDVARPEHLPQGVEHVRVDLLDDSATLATLTGSDLVFHAAGNPNGALSLREPVVDFHRNATITLHVAMACARLNARLVHLSSAFVYAPNGGPFIETARTDATLPYAASKLAAELEIRALVASWDLDAVIARPFVAYGPGQPPNTSGEVGYFLRWALNGQPIPVVGDLDQKVRDFVHAHDLAAALILVAARAGSGQVINIGSGTATPLRELAAIIASVIGHPPELDVDSSVLDDSYPLVADITLLRQLQFAPAYPLSTGVRLLAEALGTRPELPAVAPVFARR